MIRHEYNILPTETRTRNTNFFPKAQRLCLRYYSVSQKRKTIILKIFEKFPTDFYNKMESDVVSCYTTRCRHWSAYLRQGQWSRKHTLWATWRDPVYRRLHLDDVSYCCLLIYNVCHTIVNPIPLYRIPIHLYCCYCVLYANFFSFLLFSVWIAACQSFNKVLFESFLIWFDLCASDYLDTWVADSPKRSRNNPRLCTSNSKYSDTRSEMVYCTMLSLTVTLCQDTVRNTTTMSYLTFHAVAG